ncbi:RNA 2',3'-cyclic phosphodiesterase [Pontivivens insulae]|uniref:RNA 2',3'-cyclic phosphodiesterase n=1 Tax=Pontivivens insulae TaxID=1639689 RepID=A0A2R8ACF5_9RHOB|nr:RNA 2',3'-cyclic phosphodiesterase [Pontivivens insulae]RED11060.1 2'-5' RNA ligase [Pontivivens insulae]SPF29765.1 RNA 2',3'-cyclic phosphodiesterase [Pontivivens insulae]
MRLFVAVPVDGPAREAVANVGAGFRCGRIVPPAQYHITLAFLGDAVGQAQAEECAALLGCIEDDPFSWKVAGLGQFGSSKPRNLHANVEASGLDRLHRSVVKAADGAGLRLERRRFVPHITLSRLRAPLDVRDAAWFAQNVDVQLGPFWADRFELIESRLSPDGPDYRTLVSYPLGPDWDDLDD